MNLDCNTTYPASDSEIFIWESSRNHKDDLSYTLSYRFLTQHDFSVEEVQCAVYRVLTEHLYNLTQRFFYKQGRLYKQYVMPPKHPVIAVSEDSLLSKPFLIEPLMSQYQFYWKPLDKGGELTVQLSHLVFDGACYKDLVSALSLAFKGTGSATPFLEFESNASTQESLDYWGDMLRDRKLSQELPFLSCAEDTSYLCSSLSLDKDFASKLKNFKKEFSATNFQVMTTAISIVLFHYVMREEENRSLSLSYYASLRSKHQPAGCYINLLPFFVECDTRATCVGLLKQIQQTRRHQKPHQAVSTKSILACANIDLNSFQDIFNVVINESEGLIPASTPALFDEMSGIDNRSFSRKLTLIYQCRSHSIDVRFESNASTKRQLILDEFTLNFQAALEHLLSSPASTLGQFKLHSLSIPVSEGRSYPEPSQPLITTFSKQASLHCDKVAVYNGDDQVTYNKLYEMVDRLSLLLSNFDDRVLHKGVGVFLSRSELLPAALLSCIKVGAFFVPIVSDFPEHLIKQILEITKIKLVFTDKMTDAIIANISPNINRIHVNNLDSVTLHKTPIIKKIDQKIAYTIFTSGSTGAPKCVQISYRNLANFLSSMSNSPGLVSHDVMLALTPTCFDISINELLLPLYVGGSIVIASATDSKNGERLAQIIQQYHVSVIQATPATIMLLKHADASFSPECRFWIGGETLPEPIVNYLTTQGCPVYNIYGPTEATIWVSTTLINDECNISLGKAVDNCRLYVIDKDGNRLPFGVPGELLIEGAPVSRGYTNALMTSFTSDTYRTGDRVVAYAQDDIRYIERIDDQVKLRGYRIETSEIDNLLLQHYRHCHFVTVLRNDSEPNLCAFYVMIEKNEFNSQSALAYLKQILPSYKVPVALVQLSKMPLNQNGKIDKKSLSNLPLSELAIVNINQPTLINPDDGSLIAKLQQLINNHFSLFIDDPTSSLISYGFSSIGFNKLSFLLSEHLGVQIKPHQFYQYSSLATLSELFEKDLRKIDPNIAGKKTNPNVKVSNENIAIIGYDALMPGSKDAQEFWDSLVNYEDLVCEHHRFSHHPSDKFGAISGVADFDRTFFKLSPLEVMQMDPRQRLLLQCAYKTLEHAGWSKTRLTNKVVGCYVAASGQDYMFAQVRDRCMAKAHTLPGNALSMLANRLSYYFDWSGPSIVVDTACSGSLSALSRAIDTLHLKKADVCFVAAANLILDPQVSEALKEGGFLSDNYSCSSFSDDADGYVRGEGVIGYLLKPLSQAIQDRDHIHAVIESISENHGGRSASLTAPRQQAQLALLKNAYNDEQCQRLSYIETHGTGTKLGDPIEIDALLEFENKALRNNKNNEIFLGALKSNIGHLEACAGFASILKVVLAMKHGVLPANLHHKKMNSLINLNQSRFTLVNENVPWQNQRGLLAGVSSFGFGGSNVHVVLSSFQSSRKRDEVLHESAFLFVLSANDDNRLAARANALVNDLRKLSHQGRVYDVAYTLVAGREALPHRVFFDALDFEDLIQKLKSIISGHFVGCQDDVLNKHRDILDVYFSGDRIDWSGIFPDDAIILPLTSYQFSNKPYWYKDVNPPGNKYSTNLLSSVSASLTASGEVDIIIPHDHHFFAEHKVFGTSVLPGVAQIEFLLEAFTLKYQSYDAFSIESLYWLHPIILTDTKIVKLTVKLAQNSAHTFSFSIVSNHVHSKGTIVARAPSLPLQSKEIAESMGNNEPVRWSREQIYSAFKDHGIAYGHYFRGIANVDVGRNFAKSFVQINSMGSLVGLLDAAFQSGMAISLPVLDDGLMPFSLGVMRIKSVKRLRDLSQAHVYTNKLSSYRTNITICDLNGDVLLELLDLGVRTSNLKTYATTEKT